MESKNPQFPVPENRKKYLQKNAFVACILEIHLFHVEPNSLNNNGCIQRKKALLEQGCQLDTCN